MGEYDVIVVGAGNAALASAVSAKENGAQRVLVLEKAPREMRGGNTHWSGGVLRFALTNRLPKHRQYTEHFPAKDLARNGRTFATVSWINFETQARPSAPLLLTRRR